MELTIIAAISENNVIGKKGKIPWYISEDLNRFKNLTLNHPVIMGRRTYESILERLGNPLPKRKNIVLTRRKTSGEAYSVRSIREALELTDNKDSYVIGGEEIYRQFLPLVNRMEITRLHKNIEGDVFFPEVNWNMWILKNEEKKKSKEGIPYSFLTYVRR